MGWFEEQIRDRKRSDKKVLEESLTQIGDVVMGRRVRFDTGDPTRAVGVIDRILRYYGSKCPDDPTEITDLRQALDTLCRPLGYMTREVRLTQGWHHDALGAMLGYLREGHEPVALIPRFGGYVYYTAHSTHPVRITDRNRADLEQEAICFYKPFPLRALSPGDLLRYALETRSVSDLAGTLLFMGLVTLLGLAVPRLTHFLYGTVVEEGSVSLLLSTMVFYVCLLLSTWLFSAFRTIMETRITTRLDLQVRAAVMMRVLSLPADFFRGYASGDLSTRMEYISSLCSSMVNLVFSTGLTTIFSLTYLNSVFLYAPALVVPALTVTGLTVAFGIFVTLLQIRLSRRQMKLKARLSGVSYAMISGIRKIKLAGAETRAFARWAGLFAQSAESTYDPPAAIRLTEVVTLAISSVGTLVMYTRAVRSGVSVADYTAFTAAYAMISGAFASLISMAATLARLRPMIEMAQPILDAVPETASTKKQVTELRGEIELSGVSFRYRDDMPYVLQDLNLHIHPGEYVAVVGRTGCGKSTLIRLLLGFETPERGAVYYDGRDLTTLDPVSLRRRIGTVTQDAGLFRGDLFSNITVSAPELTQKEAWQAAELAGIADDIRAMPMGMSTMVSEGSGGISGGQRQRLMIARALAPGPAVLLLDEATSALDNLTQKKIAQSLDSLHCTRIVIAHRLSTIRTCDRILYLEDGRVKEDGTYDSLMAQKGLFYALVSRQQLESQDRDPLIPNAAF